MQCSLIPPPPQHAPQAAARLNGGAYTFVTTKINIMSINTKELRPHGRSFLIGQIPAKRFLLQLSSRDIVAGLFSNTTMPALPRRQKRNCATSENGPGEGFVVNNEIMDNG